MAMLARSSVAARTAAPTSRRDGAARVVPRAASIDPPAKQYKESGAEMPMSTIPGIAAETPYDNYKFAPIREATVRACHAGAQPIGTPLWLG